MVDLQARIAAARAEFDARVWPPSDDCIVWFSGMSDAINGDEKDAPADPVQAALYEDGWMAGC